MPKFFISSTDSERIIDTLDFPPHTSPKPHISSTDRLLMAANDTTDALKHPHTDVPFAMIGDDTITALSQLATIFKSLQRRNFFKHQPGPLKTNNHQH
jgi:hypothetical protein